MSTPQRVAARGAEVIGHDRYAPGHDRGAAGGESRIFRAAHGLDHEVLDRDALARRYPQHRLQDGHTAVLDRQGCVIRPWASVQTAATRAEQPGARMHRYTPVREVVPAAGGGVRIVTDHGTDHVDAAVVTAGPWINTLLPDLPRAVDCTESGNPLAGHLPGEDDVIVMAGFSGSGFTFSPAIGEIAADLALDGSTEHPVGFLAPAGAGAG